MKRCTKCGEEKALEEFHSRPGNTDGRRGSCKACAAKYRAANRKRIAEQGRAYRAANRERVTALKAAPYVANRERIAEQGRAYRAANRERIAERGKAHYAANRERIAELGRAYRAANREQLAARRAARYVANRERVAERTANYYRTPEGRAVKYASAARRRARRVGAECGCVSAPALDAVRQIAGGLCAYCGRQPAAHVDHVEPLADGGRHCVENLLPACASCNLTKGARPLAYLLARLGRDAPAYTGPRLVCPLA